MTVVFSVTVADAMFCAPVLKLTLVPLALTMSVALAAVVTPELAGVDHAGAPLITVKT